MAETGRFNPPFERTTWIWVASAAVVAVALTFWATSGNEPRQLTAENTTIAPYMAPPITQPTPARPAPPDEL
jgi:hypothetical protein